MLTSLRKRLESILEMEEDSDFSDGKNATSFAATALLIEAARSDSDVTPDELELIEQSLVLQLGVHAEDIKQTIQLAQNQLDHATCLYEITKIINHHWTIAEKIGLLEAMWRVVLSDQHLDPHEQHLMRKIKGLLYLSQSEYISAKMRAKEALATQGNG